MTDCTFHGMRYTIPRCTEKGHEGWCPFRGSFDLCSRNPENRLQEISDRFEAKHGEPRHFTTKTG